MRGQATVETLVAMLALVPIFVLIPLIGKYVDIKAKAVEASRYAVFERTVFSDPNASWGSAERQRFDQRVAKDVNERILGDPRSGISSLGDATVADNPLWTDHRGQPLLAAAPVERLSVALAETESPVARTPLLDAVSGRINLIFDAGLGLNKRSRAETSVAISATRLPDVERRGAATDIVDRTERIAFLRTGSILTDPWMPGDEAIFADRIDGLTADELIAVPVATGTFTFGFVPPFFEGIKGQDFGLVSESGVVPPEVIDPLEP